MSKWPHVPDKKKKQILEYNREKAVNMETADDFHKLLSCMKQGHIKQLMKDEECAAILRKYGITGG